MHNGPQHGKVTSQHVDKALRTACGLSTAPAHVEVEEVLSTPVLGHSHEPVWKGGVVEGRQCLVGLASHLDVHAAVGLGQVDDDRREIRVRSQRFQLLQHRLRILPHGRSLGQDRPGEGEALTPDCEGANLTCQARKVPG